MWDSAKVAVNTVLRRFGYQISRTNPDKTAVGATASGSDDVPVDFNDAEKALWNRVRSHTMVFPERIASLRQAVHYVVSAGIKGDLVECGVWRGGCSLAMVLTLLETQDTSRELYLYDTFEEGWPPGESVDVNREGKTAHQMYVDAKAAGVADEDLWAQEKAVKDLMESSGYPPERIHVSKGKVEDTIPRIAPEQVAILRLDTDWYASTKHEMIHLYPRLARGGVLIIDDYGDWKGSRKAVDEYLREHGIDLLLHRVDVGGCRVAVKP